MKTIIDKVTTMLYNHQWGRDFLLTLFQALRFFWIDYYNASKNPMHKPPVDWYIDFWKAGNQKWEVMESFSDEQIEILNYFCTQIAKKFDFYNSNNLEEEENALRDKALTDAEHKHEKQCQADDEDRHLGFMDAEEVNNDAVNDFMGTFDS